jgi:hypothetical protein
MVTDQVIAEVDDEHSFVVSLEPHEGMSLLTVPADAPSPPSRRRPIGDERALATEKVWAVPERQQRPARRPGASA